MLCTYEQCKIVRNKNSRDIGFYNLESKSVNTDNNLLYGLGSSSGKLLVTCLNLAMFKMTSFKHLNSAFFFHLCKQCPKLECLDKFCG